MKKIIVLLSVLCSISTYGREKVGEERKSTVTNLSQKIMADCAAPKAAQELWVNNVRTIIYSGGDMWWDLQGNGNAYYIIPATSNRNTGISSSFAGSIWLGGLDAGGQLKVAAMTYRQSGIDFWPGPLDTVNTAADPAECLKYDQIFTITRNEVDNFVAGGPATPNILAWPGNGDLSKNQGKRLAPFVDVNQDGFYDPTGSTPDYPAYDVQNLALKDNLGFCKTKLYGDQTLFWVFNDKGGAHTETEGVAIGVEVRAQAFAFKTNDEINNMTFYNYEVHNRSSFQLNQTFFSIWNDADLGYYLDDYVGCDVSRGLGYIYNADPFDETASGTNGYGDFPPALGCDFFRGPLADPGDGIDNDNDGLFDEPGETIQMSRFTYYNNNIGAFPPQTTNPAIAIHYYNFMTGFWKDGSPFTFGGNAYGGTAPATFVYDGNPVAGTGWTEKSAGNLPGDRRFLQSAGPFKLLPGAVNEITFGMPWAQSPVKGGNLSSIDLLKTADDKAQALFDNCFKLLDGPEAPDLTIQEMNNELIVYLSNKKGTNNYKQFNNDYAETDISILSDPTSTIAALNNPDKVYRFEGYIVYQIINDKVTSTDLGDRTKAIPVFQCDVQNNVSRIVNFELDNNLGFVVPKVKVDGANNGVVSTFKITDDAFSTSSNRKLINNKTYYFFAVAYAYNNYLTYAPDVPVTVNPAANFLGQKRPYLEGRKFKRAAGIPHIPDPEKDGTTAQAAYGFGPKITRIEGQGNGGNKLTMTKASEDEIVTNFFKADVTYENAQGPINIKVVDPLNVRNSDFTFKFINNLSTATTPQASLNAMPTGSAQAIAALNIDNTSWELKDLASGIVYHPNAALTTGTVDVYYETIKVGNEFYFPDLGFSLTIKQVADPGEFVGAFTNFANLDSDYSGPAPGSFIGATISYENGTANWLNSVPDVDGNTPFNWILSGNNKTAGNEDAFYKKDNSGVVKAFYDPKKQFGNILGGTWAPYPLAASYYSLTSSSSPNVPARVFGGPGLNGKIWQLEAIKYPTIYGTPGDGSPSLDGNTDLRKLGSALIVFTKDKSKWTRCAVLEMQEKNTLSEGGGIFFGPRKHASVNKDGVYATGTASSSAIDDPAFISATGMGWFPGYAINLETGERLNMAFGEDSYQKENNGNDMKWNPTSSMNSPYNFAFGGKHFVYVFGGNSIQSNYPTPGIFGWEATLGGKAYGQTKYDHGARIINVLENYFGPSFNQDNSGAGLGPLNGLERDIMWVSMPMPAAGYNFTNPENMPSDVRFQINVAKPYRYGYSGVSTFTTAQSAININKFQNVNSPSFLTTDVNTTNPQNNNFPMYKFNTSDIATLFQEASTAKNALDLIRVVPNPYYGSSAYEVNRIDNRVRITNLPSKCTIKIFTMNGTLVKTITRDVSGQEDIYLGTSGSGTDIKQAKRLPYADWDLKNQSGISVASGLYIFYVDAPGIGEKIIKWFGAMRPLDVQSY
ncbi:MAG: hypothetical protein Q7W45_06895 [Bacteroidota bacterium]|nr:hypothetical protein [Bacteroidota bacterium]MDP3146556.1 hypothetical protein [Bacteroidota bacterium]